MTERTTSTLLGRIPLLERLWSGVITYALKFGVVGLVGLVVDVGIFNLLRLADVGDAWYGTPLGAKVVSTSVAIIANWIGNRYWTFRQHRRSDVVRELVEYAVVSVGGMLIALACLWVSHHLLGFRSLLADNIATNVVGLGLGTLFRFVLYRYWVYGGARAGRRKPELASDLTGELALIESDHAATRGTPTVAPAPLPTPAPIPTSASTSTSASGDVRRQSPVPRVTDR